MTFNKQTITLVLAIISFVIASTILFKLLAYEDLYGVTFKESRIKHKMENYNLDILLLPANDCYVIDFSGTGLYSNGHSGLMLACPGK